MTQVTAMLIVFAGMVTWFIIRHPARRRARKTAVAVSARGFRETLLMVISGIGLGLIPMTYIVTNFESARFRFLSFADYPFEPGLAWIGSAMLIASMVLFYRTHKDLGRNWSVSLDIRQNHKLITKGVYAWVRHPMYSAFWLWAIAQALLLPNWIAGPAGILGFGTLFFGRVFEEERLMLKAFGEEYRNYMNRTARVLPGIY